jgi:hypothetical protein
VTEPAGAVARRLAETITPLLHGVQTMSSPLRILHFSLVALVVAACSVAGGGSSPNPSPSANPDGIAYPTGAGDLVIRLRYVGGFAPPSAHILDLPVISIYGDGTVIVPGPVPAIYPGPSLPNLQQATITPAGMQILLEAAREAGLFGPDAHYDLGGIMDASSSEFTVNADGRVHTISAYALFEAGGREPQNPGADPAVMAARARLLVFQNQLGNLEALLGPEVGDATPYVAESLQLLVTHGAPVDEQALGQEPIAWPLEAPLATFGEPMPALIGGERCGVVSGDDVARLLPLFERANTLTPWTDDDAAFGILVRPLLPGEAGCQAPGS